MGICDGYDWNDSERPEYFEQKIVRTRIVRFCCECHELIVIGAKYQKSKGKWEGDWYEFHTCLVCAQIRTDLASCVPFGYLATWLKEYADIDL